MENGSQITIFSEFFQFYMARLVEVLSFKIKKVKNQKNGESETR